MTRHSLIPNIALTLPPWATPQLAQTPAYTRFETKIRLPDIRVLAETGQIRRYEGKSKLPVPWSRPEIAASYSSATQPEFLKSP